jgi:hypothetical protein
VLVARKDPCRHQRVASRWLLRLLEEDPHATIEEAALAAAWLVALTGGAYEEARSTLRAMAETASSRRAAKLVARARNEGLRGGRARAATPLNPFNRSRETGRRST